jgi:PAS domain-containing protein
MKRAFAAGEKWEDTFLLRGKDGKFRWFLTQALPVRDAAGRIVQWFGTNTGVTDQKASETALRASEEQFRVFFDLAATGHSIVDATRSIA